MAILLLVLLSLTFKISFASLIFGVNNTPHHVNLPGSNSDLSLASRLNKFYVSSDLVQSVSFSRIRPCCFSDHDLVDLVIDFSHFSPPGPGLWKFNNSLLSDTDFCDHLSSRILDLSNCIPHFVSFKDWWEFFKRSLKQECIDFAKQKRTKLNREKVNLTNRLIKYKQLLINGDISVSAEIVALEARLLALSHLELGVKTRSRARWIEEGEKPTRYFFQLERERIEKNRIISMFDSNGNEVSSCADLAKVHVEFYTQLFSEEAVDMTCQQHLFLQLNSKLTAEESLSCEGPISPFELAESLKSLASNKSPGQTASL